MEENSKISQISNRIDKAPFGSAFVVSDFTDLAEYETVKKTLSRLEKKGMIRRVLRGVYDKPKFSTLLQEYAAPIPDQIAHAIGRSYNWTISAMILFSNHKVPEQFIKLTKILYTIIFYFFCNLTLFCQFAFYKRFYHRNMIIQFIFFRFNFYLY